MSENNNMGGLSGYLATPTSKGPWPCLIVIQEWWGLDQQTKSIADRFAALGYLAFSPDLYHGELAQLGDSEKAMQLVQKYGPTAALDTQQVFDTLKNSSGFNRQGGERGFLLWRENVFGFGNQQTGGCSLYILWRWNAADF